MNTTKTATHLSYVWFVKKHSAVLTQGTVTCTHTISTNHLYVIDVRRVLHSEVSWLLIKLSIVQLKHGFVPRKVVEETTSAKGTLLHMQNPMMDKCLCALFATISVHGWKKILSLTSNATPKN